MKYTKEMTDRLKEGYENGTSPADLAAEISVPIRSVIAKLSSMGIYKKKVYTTKRGEMPIKKYEQIEKLAILLNVNPDLLESLEKVNKSVLFLLERELSAKKCVCGQFDPKATQTE